MSHIRLVPDRSLMHHFWVTIYMSRTLELVAIGSTRARCKHVHAVGHPIHSLSQYEVLNGLSKAVGKQFLVVARRGEVRRNDVTELRAVRADPDQRQSIVRTVRSRSREKLPVLLRHIFERAALRPTRKVRVFIITIGKQFAPGLISDGFDTWAATSHCVSYHDRM